MIPEHYNDEAKSLALVLVLWCESDTIMQEFCSHSVGSIYVAGIKNNAQAMRCRVWIAMAEMIC